MNAPLCVRRNWGGKQTSKKLKKDNLRSFSEKALFLKKFSPFDWQTNGPGWVQFPKLKMRFVTFRKLAESVMLRKCCLPCVYNREGFNNNIITLVLAEIPISQAKRLYCLSIFLAVHLSVCLWSVHSNKLSMLKYGFGP